jgi:hypothetical protein
LHDGSFVADPEGAEYPDWQAASDHALVRAGLAVKDRGAAFWNGEHLRIVVTDKIGTALFELRLSGHLPLEPAISSPLGPERVN